MCPAVLHPARQPIWPDPPPRSRRVRKRRARLTLPSSPAFGVPGVDHGVGESAGSIALRAHSSYSIRSMKRSPCICQSHARQRRQSNERTRQHSHGAVQHTMLCKDANVHMPCASNSRRWPARACSTCPPPCSSPCWHPRVASACFPAVLPSWTSSPRGVGEVGGLDEVRRRSHSVQVKERRLGPRAGEWEGEQLEHRRSTW